MKKVVITRTVCYLINGDRKIDNERRVTQDLDGLRKHIFQSTKDCKNVRFTYEEISE